MKRILFVVFVFFFLASCSSVPKRLTANPEPGTYQELGEAKCTSCSLLLLQTIPIRWGEMPARAYNCAVRSKGGDDLINPAIQESWFLTPLGHLRCTNVSGTVIKLTE